MLEKLPKMKDSMNGCYYYLYQGFSVHKAMFKVVISFQHYFLAHDDDIVLASCPKSGTTWLKALTFAILNRNRFSLKDSPLLNANPHDLVPVLGHLSDLNSQPKDLENTKPRLYIAPFWCENCTKLVFMVGDGLMHPCHQPSRILISAKLWTFVETLWTFLSQLGMLYPLILVKTLSQMMSKIFFDLFCRGIHPYGSCWDHILGFWSASLEEPDKVLFPKYKDLKRDNVSCIKKVAEFVGFPFSLEEEKQGMLEELKILEVNKNGKHPVGIPYSSLFRKGEVGDWMNYLTSSMIERAHKLMEDKFRGSNSTFELSPHAHKSP
ncbi:hypothetical protein UlMin_024951 [Ulmus minor]